MVGLAVFCMGCLVLLLGYMWLEGRKDTIIYEQLSFSNLPQQFEGTRLFFISDIHRRVIGRKILENISHVDFIVIGGDLTEKGVPFNKVRTNLKNLRSIAPTYFVWGNNDHEVDTVKLVSLLKEERIHILQNDFSIISKGVNKLFLVGVDDVGYHLDNLEHSLSGCPNDGFTILISHNPEILFKIQTHQQINLILSGHTHGGQIRLFGFGLKDNGDLKALKDDKYMLISNGYGTTGLPLRLSAPAQTHIITLTSK